MTAAGPGVFAQAPHAAVRAEPRPDRLRDLWLRDPRHVLPLGPELAPRHHRHERGDDDRRVLQSAADRAHRDRRVPAGAERAQRLRLHRIPAAGDQARRHPLGARAAAIGGDRLDVRRHRERQRRGQRHHHRFGHHTRHDRGRHAARHRGRDRVGLLARRPIDAAGDGRRGLSDGRIPGQELFRRGRARLCAGADLLRHRRRVGVSAGAAPPHAPRRRHLSRTDLAGPGQSRRLPLGDCRPGRDDGGLESRAELRRALRLHRGRRFSVCRQSRVGCCGRAAGRSRSSSSRSGNSSIPTSR